MTKLLPRSKMKPSRKSKDGSIHLKSLPGRVRVPTLKVEKALNEQFYVVLRGANGEKVAWTETYTRKADAERARQTVLGLLWLLPDGPL